MFGGTTEGRRLHEFLRDNKIPALTCVATEYGTERTGGDGVKIGRLGRAEMAELIRRERPARVIDATHPYAAEASANIAAACSDTGAEYVRVLRESSYTGGCFGSLEEIVERLKSTEGQVFVTLGAKEARAMTALPGYKERLWLRLLPSEDSLGECLRLGFPARRLICMQGPFSMDMNISMFRHAGAQILVTKESGGAGGFTEKMEAAEQLGMEVFVLGRPAAGGGMSLEDVFEGIKKL